MVGVSPTDDDTSLEAVTNASESCICPKEMKPYVQEYAEGAEGSMSNGIPVAEAPKMSNTIASTIGTEVCGASICYMDSCIQQDNSIPPIVKTFERASTLDTYQRRQNPVKLKMRAVSSPSLHDPLFENSEMKRTSNQKSPRSTAKRPNSYPTLNVLEKFKRTLASLSKQTNRSEVNSAFESSSSSSFHKELTDASTQASWLPTGLIEINGSTNALTVESTTTRRNSFRPIDRRQLREFRKANKNESDENHLRRVDAAIQVEMDLDLKVQRGARHDAQELAKHQRSSGTDAIVPRSMQHLLDMEFVTKVRSLRRAYSAKNAGLGKTIPDFTQAASPPKRDMMCSEREPPESLPVRSISHPHGLQALGVVDKPDSECDSNSFVSHDGGVNYYPALAQAIHNFTAIGPHELGLERGMLVEVLSREAGSWWFGRIKKDDISLVQEILDPELGWFPKDFVRIIPFSHTDEFLLTHTSMQISQTGSEILQPIPTTSSNSTRLPSTRQDSILEKKCYDQNNVTTIVIEPLPSIQRTSPPPPLSGNNVVLAENPNVMRLNAVKELLTTEINYVKLLTSICEGFLPAMTKRIDIFSPNSIRIIFSNITTVYGFQRNFLLELQKGIEQDQIAKVFLKMHKGFLCYSTYCNSYPRALIELESYQRIKEAGIVLENCRESENLTEFPLAAHLLSPVQRICRYPLHLSEILKMTSQSGDDLLSDQEIKDKLEQLERLEASKVDLPDTRRTVEMALEAMKGVTEAVNEGKRHSETIARHQATFQNFKGPPLHLHSIRFFLQIDATRQKQNLWNSSYTLFLFDNQLVYCKRDIIKRSQFIYKGRINIDRCRVVNVRDGKMFGQTIKNALRIYCEVREKWYDFCFRSANRKQKFLHTLALERQFGGKALYVSEMTGFDYALRERSSISNAGNAGEFSDQSDYELYDTDYRYCGGGGGGGGGDYSQDLKSNNGGDSSLPDSPSRLLAIGSNVTLPKKSKSRDFDVGSQDEIQTGSLGRRRLGNWFRRPKSSNSTPNLSPTHKPLIPIPLVTQSKELQLGVINRLGNAATNGSTAARCSAEV